MIEIRENGVNCPAFHCVLQQHSLFSKEIRMNSIMNIVVRIMNKIRCSHNALKHKNSKNILENLNSEYGNLLLSMEDSWLSNKVHTTRKPIIFLFLFIFSVYDFKKLN